MGTRMLTTAAKLYGVPYGLEPAGPVSAAGVVARMFGAAAAGCDHLHYYEGQLAQFNALKSVEQATERWLAEKSKLTVKRPFVNIAAMFPRTSARRDRNMGADGLGYLGTLRDLVDFDLVDDRVVGDNLIDRYRYLLLGPCHTLEEKAYNGLQRWLEQGGVMIAAGQETLETWAPGKTRFEKVTSLAPMPEPWFKVHVDLPLVSEFHPGKPVRGMTLDGIWSHAEGDARWGGKDAAIEVLATPGIGYDVTLIGAIPVGGEVRVNDVKVADLPGENGEQEATFTVPAACMVGRNRMRLEFRMGAMDHPTDKRELCIYPRTIRLTRGDGKGTELVLGVDIDAYDLTIDTPDGTLGISATSDKDGIRFAVLGLTVDLDE